MDVIETYKCIFCHKEFDMNLIVYPICHEVNVCMKCAYDEYTKSRRMYCFACRRDLNIFEYRASFYSRNNKVLQKFIEHLSRDVEGVINPNINYNQLEYDEGIPFLSPFSTTREEYNTNDFILGNSCTVYCTGNISYSGDLSYCNVCARTNCQLCDSRSYGGHQYCNSTDLKRVGKVRGIKCYSCNNWVNLKINKAWCNYCNIVLYVPIPEYTENTYRFILRNHLIIGEDYQFNIPKFMSDSKVKVIDSVYRMMKILWGKNPEDYINTYPLRTISEFVEDRMNTTVIMMIRDNTRIFLPFLRFLRLRSHCRIFMKLCVKKVSQLIINENKLSKLKYNILTEASLFKSTRNESNFNQDIHNRVKNIEKIVKTIP